MGAIWAKADLRRNRGGGGVGNRGPGRNLVWHEEACCDRRRRWGVERDGWGTFRGGPRGGPGGCPSKRRTGPASPRDLERAREGEPRRERTDRYGVANGARRSLGGSARGDSQESERTDAASETEQEVQRYLKDVQYPASKDELVSAARSNDAPEELIKKLVALTIREYSDLEDVAVAADNLGGSGG